VSRNLVVAAAQMGPVARTDTRTEVVERLVELLEKAAAEGAALVAYPELALTTFFPRWWMDDNELATFFDAEVPGPSTEALFAEARRLGVGVSLGYAELTDGHRYNSTVLVDGEGRVVTRYRKVHLPGHEQYEPWRPFQHLERAYFEPGPETFTAHPAFGGIVGLATCNDRRWSETYRILGLQGVELILIGYNTPIHFPPDPGQDRLAGFHNNLVMAAGAYQNGAYVVGVAKGGLEEGVASLADSQIIGPSGEVLARATTDGDEVVVAEIDLDLCSRYTSTVFDFDRYRRPELYGSISALRCPVPPSP
jgi:predicted amidohydrolase